MIRNAGKNPISSNRDIHNLAHDGQVTFAKSKQNIMTSSNDGLFAAPSPVLLLIVVAG
jgi:hypothetical protein